MEIQTLKATRRDDNGTRAARKLRRHGKVPGVLYGHGEDVLALVMPEDQVKELAESGHHVVSLDVGGQQERALVKDIQWDTWGESVLHVDFSRVAFDEMVTVSVSVVAHGEPKPVQIGGAVLEQPLHTLEVTCTADHIPDEFVVEVQELDIGDMLHVKDLALPEGVKAVAEPDTIVFVVHEARHIEEAATAPEEAVSAIEPEVIGRQAKPEGAEPEASNQAGP